MATAVSRGHDVLDLTQEVASVSDIDDVYGDQNDDDDASSKGDDVIDLNSGGKYGRAMHIAQTDTQ